MMSPFLPHAVSELTGIFPYVIVQGGLLYQISFQNAFFLLSETPLFPLTRGNGKMTSEIFSWLIRRLKFLG